jgi:hypothetical protein
MMKIRTRSTVEWSALLDKRPPLRRVIPAS